MPSTRGPRSTAEQQELARGWLRRTGRDVTSKAVTELAPHVKTTGRPEPLEIRAFARLVRLGQIPTAAAVQGEQAALNQAVARQRRRRRARADALNDIEVSGRLVADFAQAYRSKHGRGPTWNELRRHAGWPREIVDDVMARLRDEGWISYDEEPGSLRAGAAFRSDQRHDGRATG